MSSSIIEVKKQEFEKKANAIRESEDTEHQVESYELLLSDVLLWQSKIRDFEVEIKNSLTILWNDDRYAILFWPNSEDQFNRKLDATYIREFFDGNNSDFVLAISLYGFTENAIEFARQKNGRILLIDGIDVDALCRWEWEFLEMIEFKFREMNFYNQPNVDFLTYSIKKKKKNMVVKEPLLIRLDEWLEKDTEQVPKMFRIDARARWIDFENNVIVKWPGIDNLLSNIKQDESMGTIIVSGAAGYGKSTFLYNVGYHYFLSFDSPVYYLNANSLRMETLEVVINVVMEKDEFPDGTLLLLDDIHQRPVLANKLIGAVLFSREGRVRIVGATRPPYFTELKSPLHGPYGWRQFRIHQIELHPNTIIDQVISNYMQQTNIQLSKGNIERLKKEVGRDLTVLGWVLQQMDHENRFSNPDQICDEAVIKFRINPIQQYPNDPTHAIAVVYAVTFFEQFDVVLQYNQLLNLGFHREVIDWLLKKGHIIYRREINDDSIGIGHANLARLYVNTLDRHVDLGWMEFLTQRLHSDTPLDINEIKLALLEAFFENQKVDARSGAILNIFHYFAPEIPLTSLHRDMTSMVRAVERSMDLLIAYFQRDPTGESSVSNSAFMCQVFSKLGRMDLAKQALEFILAQQRVNGEYAEFILDINRVTTVRDFEEIKKRTALEDQNPDIFTYELLTKIYGDLDKMPSLAENTDFDRFHQTWLSALVIPSIFTVLGESHPRFNQTLNTVLQNQGEDGWFYPKEFCWSTARCLINLAHVGIPVGSAVIEKGKSWLLKLQLDDGRWRSPDWRWNPDEEMTAMSLYALLKSGLEKDHPAIQRATNWLITQQKNGRWNDNAHDTGHVVEALNALEFSLTELREPLRFLERRVSSDDWYQTIIGENRRQSLEIGELANVLLDVETRYLFDYVKGILSTRAA